MQNAAHFADTLISNDFFSSLMTTRPVNRLAQIAPQHRLHFKHTSLWPKTQSFFNYRSSTLCLNDRIVTVPIQARRSFELMIAINDFYLVSEMVVADQTEKSMKPFSWNSISRRWVLIFGRWIDGTSGGYLVNEWFYEWSPIFGVWWGTDDRSIFEWCITFGL